MARMLLLTMLPTLLAVAALAGVAAAGRLARGVSNTLVKRSIDATGHVVRESVEVKLSAEASVQSYHVALTERQSSSLAHISAQDGRDRELLVRRDDEATRTDSEGGFVLYQITLAAPTTSEQLTIDMAFVHLLQPFPTQIAQAENQFVKLAVNNYFASPYPSAKQTTTLQLASDSVESFSKKVKPVSRKGDTITFGAYDAVPAWSRAPNTVHFQSNVPFVTLTSVEREVEVSHWGNVAVEEVVDMKNTGAALKGGFSRLDYQQQQQRFSRGPHFREVVAKLPRRATDVYYRDIIGNISTSNLRENGELLIQPRFPLFGGWRVNFYYGYNMPLADAVTFDGDKYTLTVDVGPSIQAAATDELKVKVVLPEGSTDVQVSPPFDVDSQSSSRRFTYLDSFLGGGRPVGIIVKRAVVDEHRSQKLTVTYRHTASSLFFKPALLVAAYFALFFVAILSLRLKLSIAPKSSSSSPPSSQSQAAKKPKAA